ncbi:MAG TPA: hypothetical protein VIU29_06895, partial [Candidatus Deferrimicrobiaceae bacterium]
YLLRDLYSKHPLAKGKKIPPIVEVNSKQFYGEGYQDIQTRTPSIRRATELLGWTPKVGLKDAMKKTMDAFLEEAAASEKRAPKKAAAKKK